MASFLALSSYLTLSSIQLALIQGAFGIIAAYGISGIAIGLGGEYANFTWEHISQLAASFGSFLCMITAVTYLGVSGSILDASSHFSQNLTPLSGRANHMGMPMFGLIINVVLSMLVTRVCLRRACRQLSRDLR